MEATTKILIKPYEYFDTARVCDPAKESRTTRVARIVLEKLANFFYWIANAGIASINFGAKHCTKKGIVAPIPTTAASVTPNALPGLVAPIPQPAPPPIIRPAALSTESSPRASPPRPPRPVTPPDAPRKSPRAETPPATQVEGQRAAGAAALVSEPVREPSPVSSVSTEPLDAYQATPEPGAPIAPKDGFVKVTKPPDEPKAQPAGKRGRCTIS